MSFLRHELQMCRNAVRQCSGLRQESKSHYWCFLGLFSCSLSFMAFVKGKRDTFFLFFFFQFSLLIAAWRVWGGGVMLRWTVIVYYAQLCLLCFKKAWFCVAHFPSFFFSQKQPKGKSSNNVIPVWAPNRHGPFKTEQQNWSQRIKLLLPLLKHKLHIQWNDRVQLSAILRMFVLWSSENVRHVDSFFRHTVCTRNSKVDTAQYVIMFKFQRSVGSGVHPCGLRVMRGVFLNRDCYGLGFRCDGVEC